ncbi:MULTISPECIES: ArpA protein [Micromonospora]|uniref:ArpA protein n=1 Tax=Micromonospora solifontis TaxID=2487138 RepID=A0ABX9WHJ0_9ACTN|nr:MULTISPECIES: ArpA protein [Micromonospora]NES16768.1 ArpA protein [Micromonospora sp. PPF5-17B]NES37741.1 ArpA protein [Micromonospora solifontis]NES58877.1 ArpA protein [Micromonospora sp. PPF5-6]RNL98006.1 ArpA protein [Micromonospora solifontis]
MSDRTTVDPAAIDLRIKQHLDTVFTDDWQVRQLSQQFRRNGYVKLRELIPEDLKAEVKAEVFRLLDLHSRRIDILMKETGETPRKMSTVSQVAIAKDSTLIPAVYDSTSLTGFLSVLAREPVVPCPWDEEKYVIIRQEKRGDTHGWHWGDFSFTLIWIIEAPAMEFGGSLQCIPHTDWNKADPKLHEHLAKYPISTYPHVSGDLYFLRSDTTLHRTIELTEDKTRIILNTCWSDEQGTRKAATHETMEAMFT